MKSDEATTCMWSWRFKTLYIYCTVYSRCIIRCQQAGDNFTLTTSRVNLISTYRYTKLS